MTKNFPLCVEEHAQMPSHKIGKLILLQGPLDCFVFCLFSFV